MSNNKKVDDYINEYFNKKSRNPLDASELFRLIEEVMQEEETLPPLGPANFPSKGNKGWKAAGSRTQYVVAGDPFILRRDTQMANPETGEVVDLTAGAEIYVVAPHQMVYGKDIFDKGNSKVIYTSVSLSSATGSMDGYVQVSAIGKPSGNAQSRVSTGASGQESVFDAVVEIGKKKGVDVKFVSSAKRGSTKPDLIVDWGGQPVQYEIKTRANPSSGVIQFFDESVRKGTRQSEFLHDIVKMFLKNITVEVLFDGYGNELPKPPSMSLVKALKKYGYDRNLNGILEFYQYHIDGEVGFAGEKGTPKSGRMPASLKTSDPELCAAVREVLLNHLIDGGDDYFCVFTSTTGDAEFYLTGKSSDVMGVGVPPFPPLEKFSLSTGGGASSGATRLGLKGKFAKDSSLKEELCVENSSKEVAASDLFKMIEEAMDKTKAKTQEHREVAEEILGDDYDEDMFDDLFEEFERNLLQSNSSLLAEKAALDVGEGKESITIQLPKFTVTEAWGDPTSDAFNQIKPFVLRAAGKGKTYEEKFNHLQRMFEGKKTKITSPGRILATLILLESWVAIIRDFSPSAAGFLFEAFLAAMTFGEQVSEVEGGSLPIEDIIAFGTGPDGQPASLKLLKKSTSIKGSYKNLIEYFTKNNAIDYIVAYKLGTDEDINKGNLKLRIMKYEVNRENFINFLLSGSGNNKKLLGPGMEEGDLNNTIDRISQMGWEDLEAHLINTTTARGVTDKTQWQISRPQFDNLDGVVELASVDLTTETMSKMNTYWAEQLGSQIRDLFGSVAALSENINKFFLDSNRQGAKSGARMAIKDTEDIKSNIAGTVKEEETEQEG